MRTAIIHNHPIHYKHLLFSEMRKLKLDFEVFFIASGSAIRHETIPLEEDHYKYRICHQGSYEGTPSAMRIRWTWASLQEARPEVVVISGFHAPECWTAWLWAKYRNVPTILWYESNQFDYPRKWFREVFKTLFLKGCHGAHVYGLSNKDYLVKLGMPADKIIVKRAVIDVQRFTPREERRDYRKGGMTRLIYVGRLAPEKNVATLLQALCLAQKETSSHIRLVIAGAGPEQAALEQQAAGLGIASLVDFRGYVPQKDLPALYREGDIFVLPSSREPWGLVALEAMLCRLPVIISSQCGCAVDVVSHETGWTFAPYDVKRLAAIIRECCEMLSPRMEAMGVAANKLASVYTPHNSACAVAQSIGKLRPEAGVIV